MKGIETFPAFLRSFFRWLLTIEFGSRRQPFNLRPILA